MIEGRKGRKDKIRVIEESKRKKRERKKKKKKQMVSTRENRVTKSGKSSGIDEELN